jgi:hypothetical protein
MRRTANSTILASAGAVLLLSLVFLAAGPYVPTAQAHPSTFSDVAETNPIHDAVEALAAEGVVSGYEDGTFRPIASVTRAQATKMLVSWRGLSAGEPGSSFVDVDGIYAAYVETAVREGWVTGYPDGSFRPQASLTRQQTAIVVMRALGLENVARSLSDAEIEQALEGFVDAGAVSFASRPYVALAVSRGLLAGDGDRLEPVLPMTRAQLCVVLYRASALSASEEDPGASGEGQVEGLMSTPTEQPVEGETFTPEEQALATFMDAHLFQPHSSPITGAMVVQNARWYGIPPLSQLVIIAAETSLGDPRLGGALARNNNFGCLRYHGSDTPWGQLSDGRIWVAGKDWYSFPSPAVGMAAFGRYLKSAVDGRYLPMLTADNPLWEEFAAIYYGRGVSGFSSYVDRLHAIERRFRQMAAEQGVSF